jgi:hypothetical protein
MARGRAEKKPCRQAEMRVRHGSRFKENPTFKNKVSCNQKCDISSQTQQQMPTCASPSSGMHCSQ